MTESEKIPLSQWIKTYKKEVMFLLMPLILSPIFLLVDEKPIVCPPPCKKGDVKCNKSYNYARTICTPHLMPCNVNVSSLSEPLPAELQSFGDYTVNRTCARKFIELGYNAKEIIIKATDGEVDKAKEMGKNHAKWDQVIDETIALDQERRAENLYLEPGMPGVVDSMDYVVKSKRADYDRIFHYQKAACMYCTLLMSIYWILELIPLAVTSLLPLILFPIFGVLPAKQISPHYFNDIIALFFGGLSVAAAIEYTNLHERIALSVLRLVGAKPRNLLFGFMAITCFLAMWISNVATAAMIFPTADAVIKKLKANLDDEQKRRGGRARAGQDNQAAKLSSPSSGDQLQKLITPASDTSESADDPEDIIENVQLVMTVDDVDEEMAARYLTQDKFSKALTCGIGYAASIGGTGMLTGCAANMILAGQLPSAGITFSSFAILNLPVTIILIIVTWLWLTWFFLRGTVKYSKSELDIVTKIIEDQYASLGPMTYQEKSAASVFGILVLFWLTRNPGFMPGWGSVPPFDLTGPSGSYIRDSTVAMAAAFLLFIIPGNKPDGKSTSAPLISFTVATQKMSWTVIFLLGGGFAMAAGVTASGLAAWIGTNLEFLENVSKPVLVLACAGVVSFVTQLAANTATITIFLPIYQMLAAKARVNPMLIMAPATTTVSHAFMLPVSTPPNALASGYGYIRVPEMMMAGIPLAIFGTLLATGAIFTLGPIAFPDIMDPCVAWWQDMSSDPEFHMYCQNVTAHHHHSGFEHLN